jgi:two-component system sensor histidine kinase UhpB
LVAAPARYLLGDSFWRAVQGWFLGNAVTQVVVTPMLVYWGRRDFRERVGFTEAICASCGLTGTLFVSFLVDHSSSALMFMYLPIPFLVWVAVRLRPFGAANALALVAVVAVVAAVKGSAVFAGESPAGAVLSIQLFLLVVGLSILSLAIAVAEREALQPREATCNRRLIDAQDDERSRIASELHDDIGQRCAAADRHQRTRQERRSLRQRTRAAPNARQAGMRISSDLTGI